MSTPTTGSSSSPGSGTAKSGSVFRTRIDAWLVILVGIAIALCFLQAWSLRNVSSGGSIAAVAIGVSSLAIVLVLTVPCRYTLEGDHLLIQCGVIRQRITYQQPGSGSECCCRFADGR